MIFCLNDGNCQDSGRCISGVCVCTNDYWPVKNNETRYSALTLPMVGAVLHDLPSLRHIYIFIFIFLVAIGLISNIFSLITFIRDHIRFTVCGVYLIIFSICGIVIMILFLTNIIIVLRYDDYLIRLWACHGYSYLYPVIVNTGVLMTAGIAIENVLNRYFGFDRFRSRKSALFISLILFILVLISNFDKIIARRLIVDQSGHFYCTYEYHSYNFWFYINNSTYYFYMITSGVIHFICIIFIRSKIKQQKQKWYRKMFIYQDILLPSVFIILCLWSYVTFRYLIDSCMIYIRFHMGFILILCIPQIFTFVIYIVPNKCYLKEFQQSWIYRIFCCCYEKQRHAQEFQVIHKLWQRRASLETVMTITSLNDGFVDSELYNKSRLEV